MAQIVDANDATAILKIGANNRALRSELRPWDMGSDSAFFRIALKSGVLTGNAIVISSPLFSCRYAGGAPGNNVMIVQHLRAIFNVTTVFTAAQEVGLDAVRLTSYSVADTGGTLISVFAGDNKMDSIMPVSGITSVRMATTTLLTAGTRSQDSNAFAISNQVGERHVNVAAGTAELPNPNQAVLDFSPGPYESPLVIRANEGLAIRNTVAFPAAGAGTLTVEMAWAEVANWP